MSNESKGRESIEDFEKEGRTQMAMNPLGSTARAAVQNMSQPQVFAHWTHDLRYFQSFGDGLSACEVGGQPKHLTVPAQNMSTD
jgi:hypothetical protein